MSFLRSTRSRILMSYVVLLAFSSLVSVLAISEILGARAGDRVDAALEQEVGEFRRLATGRDPRTGEPFGNDVRRIFEVYLSRNVPADGETIATYVDGELYESVSSGRGGRTPVSDLPGHLAEATRSEAGEIEGPNGAVRYLAVPLARDGRVLGTFVVSSDLGAELDEVRDATRISAIVIGSVLLIASLLAWIVAGRVLSPLRALRDTARSIGESDLTRRIDVHGADELADLARTFNAMLDRLQVAFDSQRAFVNDASHELRTPITIVRGHLELMGDDPAERRETVALVTDELDRMSRFVDDLLLLAKARRDDFLHLEPVDVGELTDEMLAKARGLAPRDWQLDGRGSGTVRADRQRLTQAVMGLAHNAVQHTEEGATIALGSESRGGVLRLWVRDEGPGIALADQERIFERFARAPHSRRRSGGAGLGLSIVRAIAEAHGGEVQLSSSPGRGSTFTIEIPR